MLKAQSRVLFPSCSLARRPWHKTEPPLVFLTNWGFFVMTLHFVIGLAGSFALWLAPSLEKTRAPRLGSFVEAVFVVAVVLEPFIVVGFWALVFPFTGQCPFLGCCTMHVIGCCLLALDGALNRLELRTIPHLPCVFVYVVSWLATQFAWVYSHHRPDYDVLTLKSWLSAVVVAGTWGFLVATFFGLQKLQRWRDRPPRVLVVDGAVYTALHCEFATGGAAA